MQSQKQMFLALSLTHSDNVGAFVGVCDCSLLLDAGCDINSRTREGSALHEAVANGHIDIVSLLLSVSIFIL